MNDRNAYQLHANRPARQHYIQPRKPSRIGWKIAAIVVCLGLAGGLTEAKAESWAGADKTLHLQAGAIIAAPVAQVTGSWQAGTLAGCAVGALKEGLDTQMPGHTPSYRDAVVTCLGAFAGAHLGVSVAPIKGGVWVGKVWQF